MVWAPLDGLVLAAVALTVGTTILIKMGKLRYAWVTALPLAWDAAVTLTASWQKIFSTDPAIGFRFVPRAEDLPGKLKVVVRDSDNAVFEHSFDVPASGS